MTNIAELLKDCPKGTKLYSPLFGEVFLYTILSESKFITVRTADSITTFNELGQWGDNSRWERFPDAECLLFPSKEVRTWEGWKAPVEPKFKVGDKVIYNGKERTITFMDDTFYDFDGGCAGCRIEKQDELLSPAPKPHYNIANFKPYQKVLIRFGNNDTWRADFFSHIKEDRGRYFVGIGYANKQCIPFEGNEHLLGATDMCSEEYVNW